MQGEKLKKLPMTLHEVVEVRHWMDSQTFMNVIVLGQVPQYRLESSCPLLHYCWASLPISTDYET